MVPSLFSRFLTVFIIMIMGMPFFAASGSETAENPDVIKTSITQPAQEPSPTIPVSRAVIAGSGKELLRTKTFASLDLAIEQTGAEISETAAAENIKGANLKTKKTQPMTSSPLPGTASVQAVQTTNQKPPFYVNPLSQTVRMVRERIKEVQTLVSHQEANEVSQPQIATVRPAIDAGAR
ncbi:MAG TPA: hypothetical protein PLO78_07130 [Candidatus Omnitrophota bacterium]|nr:hypothetical protein [Candidatus Omnitrophota bacterium]